MNQQKKHSASHYSHLLLSILFIGTSGPLGRLIHLSPLGIIFFRSLIALGFLYILIRLLGKSYHIHDKKRKNYILISGIFLTAHWVTYFFSLQLSSVAIGMLSMFTYPVITVILEPFYLQQKFKPIQIPVAMIAFLGIYIMLPSFDISNNNTLGIMIGILSGFLYACRNLLLKKHAHDTDGMVVISHQLKVVSILTFPFLFFVPVSFTTITSNWYYLLFLGLVTTALGHTFYVKSLRHFSAATVSILSNFTPVVGIVLGIIFLQENPSGNILLGGSLILFTALLEVWMGMKNEIYNNQE